MTSHVRRTGDPSARRTKVRYAVVGLGHIAQAAVLPAFAHAEENSELVALISSDATKLKELSERYGVVHHGSYDDFESVLERAEADAVYIALPNTQHREYAERAARCGVHVLCEKPLAPSVEDCVATIQACERARVRLMVAYRLHFEEANLRAMEIARSGELGEVRLFSSVFTQNVEGENIRTERGLAGGALLDMGIYCVNAARNVFRDEPIAVFACQTGHGEERFRGIDGSTMAILRFSGDRFAEFTTSIGAAAVDSYRVVGTRGELLVEPAYSYHDDLKHRLTVEGETKETIFTRRDQFAPELVSFSKHILEGTAPEPSGEEGLADARVIDALFRSAVRGQWVKLERFERANRPDIAQEIRKPPVKEPRTIHAHAPSTR